MNKLSAIEAKAERMGWTTKAVAHDANDNQYALSYIEYKGEYCTHRVCSGANGISFEAGTYHDTERSALKSFYNRLSTTDLLLGGGE